MNQTQTAITTIARRIAREHNAILSQASSGGVLAFDHEGRGGEWYSAGSWPAAAIIYPVADRPVTQREVQDWLDNADEPETQPFCAACHHHHDEDEPCRCPECGQPAVTPGGTCGKPHAS